MKKAIDIIKAVAKKTDRVILFHSASGKDSIALLDLISPYFKEIVCVYMYVIKDLSHNNRYINYACKKYPNMKYIQIPHFALYSYRRIVYMVFVKNEKQKLYNMAQLTDIVREKYKIEWAFFGSRVTCSSASWPHQHPTAAERRPPTAPASRSGPPSGSPPVFPAVCRGKPASAGLASGSCRLPR